MLSPKSYNQKSGLAILCPVTSQVNGYAFQVLLPGGSMISGAVLSDQLKSLDWKSRHAQKAGRVSASILAEVLVRLSPLLFC
jgi:mRNA interferase MazF